MFYVYAYLDGDKTVYVGKGHKNRDVSHLKKCGNYRFGRYLKEMRQSNREIKIVRIEDGLNEPDAYKLEAELIAKIGRVGYEPGGTLMNYSMGGQGGTKGVKLSLATRAKMSDARRVENLSDARRAALSEQHTKIWANPEHRAARTAALIRAAQNPETQKRKSESMKALNKVGAKHHNSLGYLVIAPDGREFTFLTRAACKDIIPDVPVSALGRSLTSGKPVHHGIAKGWSMFYKSR